MIGAKHRRFDALVGALTDDLFRYACWLSGDRQLAEDLVQETLLRAWRFLDSLKDPEAVKAWLITTLRREHARLYQRRQFDYVDHDLFTIADPNPSDPEAGTEQHRLRQRIHALPADYREPLALQVILGCSVREIAVAMELSENVVMTRLFRARRKLMDGLEKHHPGRTMERVR
ncbi:sigma-70 family RNA polymerase sigma factor [Salinisphaera aquimarina]|uniref:Sigma-70 family RNA polymerase sigma factor n=1 Tax=Salinisphaera aquimarina TaxID=2094031 RepID=A0ABV7EUJ3_9GAMM